MTHHIAPATKYDFTALGFDVLPFGDDSFAATFRIPELEDPLARIAVTGGHHPVLRDTQRRAPEHPSPATRLGFQSVHVPDRDSLVPTTYGQSPTVGRESDAVDVVGLEQRR